MSDNVMTPEEDEEAAPHHAAHAVCCLKFLGEAELENGGQL